MKKFFIFSLALVFAAFSANAQVAYLLTEASIEDFPAETFNEVDQQPERNAANWFKANYVDKEHGSFISIADLKAGLSDDVKVLWINVDRVGLADLAAAGIDEEVVAAVKAFVENGGDVYLTKQANHIAFQMGRIGYAPGWSNGGYVVGGDTWCIGAQLGMAKEISEKFDRSSHPIFAGLEVDNTTFTWDDYNGDIHTRPTFPMVGAVARTDNNNMWVDMFRKEPLADGEQTHYDNLNPLRLTEFESDWNCTVLAVWGHVLDFCGVGIIEFKPQVEGQGTILTNGFAAYQWGTANNHIDNVQLLTKNSLNYLLGYNPDEETVETDLWAGNQHVTWGASLKIEAAKFANAQPGNKLVVHYANASDGIEFKVLNDNFDHLAGSREAAWISGNGIFEQFLTDAAVESLKAYGLEIIGANFDLTQVELLEGKELKEDVITIWTGFFWADDWKTLELYKEGYSFVDWNNIEALRIYSEAGRTNYTINVKSSWEDDGHIADKGAMTDGEGYAELPLTDDIRAKLAASPHLMIQFDKGEGEPFNVTDVVLVEKSEIVEAIENVDFYNLPADAVIYNILGMRVKKEDAHGGIFIVNGHKLYLK